MFTNLRIIISFVVIVGGLGIILYNITKYYLALAPNSSRISKEYKKIKSLLVPSKSDLIPFTTKEFQLLSAQIKEVIESSYTKGKLYTIFSELLITYGYYNFFGTDRSVLVVETSKHTLEYNFREDDVEILSNGLKLAYIDHNGIHSPTLELNYQFVKHLQPEYIHIQCNGELIGKVIQYEPAHPIHVRAVQLEKGSHLYHEELFLAATAYLLLI